MSYPYSARALMKYKPPPGGSTFSFQAGDLITVLEAADDDGDWLKGRLGDDGEEGVFPSNFVEAVKEEQASKAALPTRAPEPVSSPVAPPVASPTPPITAPAQQSRAPEPASEDSSAPPKPMSLKERIAALNASGAGAAPPPAVKPKPSFARKPWAPPVVPQFAAPPPATSTSTSSISSPPAAPAPRPQPLAQPAPDERASASNKGFSPQDAASSVGTMSLKDRMKALEAQNLALEKPTVLPGRAPKPMAWKVKMEPTEADEEAVYEKAAAENSATAPGTETVESNTIPLQTDDDPSVAATTTSTEPIASSPPISSPPAMGMAPLPKRAGPPRRAKAPVATPLTPPPVSVDDEVSPASQGSPEAIDDGNTDATNPTGFSESDTPSEHTLAGQPQSVSKEQSKVEPIERNVVNESAVDSSPTSDPTTSAPTRSGTFPIAGSHIGKMKDVDRPGDDEEDDFDTPALPAESDEEGAQPNKDVLNPVDIAAASRTNAEPLLKPAEEAPTIPAFEEPTEPEVDQEEGSQQRPDAHEVSDLDDQATSPPPLPKGRPALPPPPPPAGHSSDTESDVVEEPEQHNSRAEVTHIEDTAAEHSRAVTHDEDDLESEQTDASDRAPAQLSTAHETSHVPPPPSRAVLPPIIPPTFASSLTDDNDDDDGQSPRSPTASSRPVVPRIPSNFAPQHGQSSSEADEKRKSISVPRFVETETTHDSDVESRQDMLDSALGRAPDRNEDDLEQTKEVVAPPPQPPRAASMSSPDFEAETNANPEEEEEEEPVEEDPEIARRRALAARMAKLGGMNMRLGPQMPPVGGLRKPKQASTSSTEEPRESSRQGSVDADPSAPPRRLPGFPAGGIPLPGMMAKPAPVATPVDPEEMSASETNTSPEDDGEKPPPLPSGRPGSQGPPRRSVPPPQTPHYDDEEDADDASPPSLPEGRPPAPRDSFVAEPSEYHHEVSQPEEEDESPIEQHVVDDEVAPPPPSRSAIPSSPPQSYPSPSLSFSADPSAPPSRAMSGMSSDRGVLGAAIPRGSSDLGQRQDSRESLDRGGRSSIDSQRGFERMASSSEVPASGAIKAADVDLAMGSQWWRAEPFSPPMSIKGRRDAIFEVSGSSATKRGKTTVTNEIEVIYDDLSKSIITISFLADDPSEAATTTSQEHFPPPATPSLPTLQQYSNAIGSQLLRSAEQLVGSRSTSEGFVQTIFGAVRQPEPLGPIGTSFGIKVLVQSAKSTTVGVDEPRGGDFVVLNDAKFKSGLLSKSKSAGLGSGVAVAVVKSWDAKKRKFVVLEVGEKGSVEEASHKLEDLKSGSVTVYRVAERRLLDA